MKTNNKSIRLLEEFLGYSYEDDIKLKASHQEHYQKEENTVFDIFKAEADKGVNNSGGQIVRTQLEYDGTPLNYNNIKHR